MASPRLVDEVKFRHHDGRVQYGWKMSQTICVTTLRDLLIARWVPFGHLVNVNYADGPRLISLTSRLICEVSTEMVTTE